MFKKKSTESVLKEIYEAYPDAFADGRRLSGLFADFSGGQLRAQKNQLDIFLKCGGNTRILALRDEAPRIQQREYHRLVGEMTDAYGMQQELALEISSTFWKTALGTQAPAMGGQEKKEKPVIKPLGTQAPAMGGQEKKEKPVIKPLGTQAPTMDGQGQNEKPAKKPSEKQPRGQRIKGLLMLFGKMSGFARLMFAVGSFGVIACTIRLIEFMITEGFADYMWTLYLMVGIYLLDLAAKVFWMLLSMEGTSDILSRVFSRRALAVLEFLYDDCLEFVFGPGEVFFYWWALGMFIGLICPSPLFLVGGRSAPTLAIIGVFACWLYNIVWVVRFFKPTKKNSPMWQ